MDSVLPHSLQCGRISLHRLTRQRLILRRQPASHLNSQTQLANSALKLSSQTQLSRKNLADDLGLIDISQALFETISREEQFLVMHAE